MEVVLHSVLRPGEEAAYESVHRTIPQDVVTMLRRVGIEDWRIWRSGSHLIHVVTCDDFAASSLLLAEDPVNERWQDLIGRYVDHFELNAEGGTAMPMVWGMADQLGSTPHL